MTGLCDSGQLVDCFLRPDVRKGFCQQFASAMVMLLRQNAVAARLAMGYLPGREQTDGVWQVDRASAHAWVEVFFPGEGWVQFDPTPGTQERGGVATELPIGHPVATASPGQARAGVPPPARSPSTSPARTSSEAALHWLRRAGRPAACWRSSWSAS